MRRRTRYELARRLMVLPLLALTLTTAPPAMTACVHEDAPGPCVWDATTSGNGHGTSFWVDPAQHVHSLP